MPSLEREFFTPGNVLSLARHLIRHGMSLTPAEFKVLMFIFDRTVGYKKHAESIPYRHFLDGVWSQGSLHSVGCGLGESTLKRALRGLVEKGVIERGRGQNFYGTYYTINYEWCHSGMHRLWRPQSD